MSNSTTCYNQQPMAPRHVVAIPYPGRGHINPMLNICLAVSEKSSHINITFIVTEEWLGLIGSISKPPNMSFATIPNILPSERTRGHDSPGWWAAVWTKMEEPVDRLLEELRLEPEFVIGDAFLPWVADVASKRNIPLAWAWAMSASAFTVLYHFDLLVANGHFPIDLSVNGDAIVDYIPGLPPVRVTDFPKGIRKEEDAPFILKLVPANPKYIIFTSVYELESNVFQALKEKSLFSIYNIGPHASYSKIKHIESSYDQQDDDEYLKWLDAQPPKSVLYISLGSFLSVSAAQMDEIAFGIHESGVRFLWAARGETNRLKEICCNGLVVDWCDQLRVLCHSSIGGYLSHCGWSSTKEALMAGVPSLTFPIIMDQVMNAKVIVEDWKVGWRMKGEFDEQELAGRDEIAEIVKRFMDLESDERKELTRNATLMQMICDKEFEGEHEHSFGFNVESLVQLILGYY